jgi:hypothetical protein
VLRGAAGVGAVGIAAAAGGGAIFAATRPASAATRPAPSPAGAAPRTTDGEPLVAYLRDAATGEFEIFHGTRQIRVRNPRLAAQLLDGLAAAQ